jgi:hypothetical protein
MMATLNLRVLLREPVRSLVVKARQGSIDLNPEISQNLQHQVSVTTDMICSEHSGTEEGLSVTTFCSVLPLILT